MEYIDIFAFEKFVKQAFSLPLDQKNALYFNMCDMIAGIDGDISKDSKEAIARDMIALLEEFLTLRRAEFEFKAAEKSEGKNPGGLFRRVL